MDFQLTRLDVVENGKSHSLPICDGNALTFHLDPYHPNCVRYVDYLLLEESSYIVELANLSPSIFSMVVLSDDLSPSRWDYRF